MPIDEWIDGKFVKARGDFNFVEISKNISVPMIIRINHEEMVIKEVIVERGACYSHWEINEDLGEGQWFIVLWGSEFKVELLSNHDASCELTIDKSLTLDVIHRVQNYDHLGFP